MLNHAKAEGKGSGGKKRKRDDHVYVSGNIKPPPHHNSKFSKQKYNTDEDQKPFKPYQNDKFSKEGNHTEEDKKPFKSFHKSNKWTTKAGLDSRPVDIDSSNWYNSVPDDPLQFPPCPPDEISQLKETAKGMMQTEITAYLAKASKDSNKAWLQTAMTQGVNRDKVAAMLLAIQEDPLYHLTALGKLISFVKPGNKNCATVMDMLTEVLVKSLLRPSQALRSFNKRPLSLLDELSAGNPAGRRRRLVAWYFEDQLKYEYRSFVDALCFIATNGNDIDKIKAVSSLARLLAANPEHEEVLLTALVNKLGDSSPKVRSKASMSLNGVLKVHPAMKGVVVEEVERLLFRPNISYKTQLTAVDFLTSMIFRVADSGVALHLLKIYFSLFKGCVKEGVVDTRLFRSLLRGVKRAYPFAHETIESISEHMETLHRIVHIAPFGIALHALSLLFMVADYKASVTDRFYTALYEKILDPELAVTKDQNDFVQLIYDALKKDENPHRVRAFIKRILQVSLFLPVQTTCSLLYTISQIISGNTLLEPNAYVKLEKDVKSEIPSSLLDDDDDDDGDERYEDVKEGEEEKPEPKHSAGGWVFRTKDKQVKRRDSYDPKHRNPAFARAEHAYYDELYPLLRHYHPTVVKFATQIYEGSTVSYDGNPLIDFSLARFLERFSFKNPKKVEIKNIPHRRPYNVKGVKALAVMSRQYITMNENEIPADEQFLHKYLQARFSHRMKDEKDGDDDGDSVASDEFEEIMRGLMPKGQMGAEDDSDEDDVDVDYAADVDKMVASLKNKKKVKRKDDEDVGEEEISSEEEGDSGEDDSDFGDLSMDEDEDLSDEEDSKKRKTPVDDFGELSDEDAEVLEFDDDEDDEFPSQKKKKAKGDGDYGPSSSVFASSEKFSELIEATAAAGRSGGSDDIINKDNSHAKQLKWEQQRDFSSKKNWSQKKKFGKGPGTKKGSFKKTKSGQNFGKKKNSGRSK